MVIVFETICREDVAEVRETALRLPIRNPRKEPTRRARPRKNICRLSNKSLLLSPSGSFRQPINKRSIALFSMHLMVWNKRLLAEIGDMGPEQKSWGHPRANELALHGYPHTGAINRAPTIERRRSLPFRRAR